MAPPPRPSVVPQWDVLEEHLAEAGSLFDQWSLALRFSSHRLAVIAQALEARFLAHLDGLLLAAPIAATRVLIPALEADAPGAVFAAAYALLANGGPAALEVVLAALEKGDVAGRAAIRRALALAPRADLAASLPLRAQKASSIQVDLLAVLAELGIDPAFPLEPLVNTKDPAKEAVCLRIARVFPARLNPLGVQRLLASPVAEVRAAAIEAGLVSGERLTMAACEATVRESGPAFATAALGLALAGEAKAVPLLVAATRNPTLAPDAVVALGFTGQVAAADALVEATGDEALARLAGEGLSAICGLTIANELLEAAPPSDSESTPEGDAALPTPDAASIAAWWQSQRARFDPTQRWLRGQRWSADGLLQELEDGPARRREALALDLAIRSQGEHRVTWNGLSTLQRGELQRARAGLARIKPFPQKS